MLSSFSFFFFFNDTATTEIYTLSLHDALPICAVRAFHQRAMGVIQLRRAGRDADMAGPALRHVHSFRDHLQTGNGGRSEEHTSELQSRLHLVCRLLLEKKK